MNFEVWMPCTHASAPFIVSCMHLVFVDALVYLLLEKKSEFAAWNKRRVDCWRLHLVFMNTLANVPFPSHTFHFFLLAIFSGFKSEDKVLVLATTLLASLWIVLISFQNHSVLHQILVDIVMGWTAFFPSWFFDSYLMLWAHAGLSVTFVEMCLVDSSTLISCCTEYSKKCPREMWKPTFLTMRFGFFLLLFLYGILEDQILNLVWLPCT